MIPAEVVRAGEVLRLDVRGVIDVLYGDFAGKDDTAEDVESVEGAIARDMAIVLDWIAEAAGLPANTPPYEQPPLVQWAMRRGGAIWCVFADEAEARDHEPHLREGDQIVSRSIGPWEPSPADGEPVLNPVSGASLGVVVSGEGVRANKIIEERQRQKEDHDV